MHACIHEYKHKAIDAYMHTFTCAHIFAHVSKHAHIHICTRMYLHTCTDAQPACRNLTLAQSLTNAQKGRTKSVMQLKINPKRQKNENPHA